MEESYVRGTCQTMCPIKEAKLREREKLLHPFEMKKGTESNPKPQYDLNKTVKSFSRSAAGAETTNPSNLRPFPVLLKTIEYLFNEVFPMHKEKPVTVYDFMFDRFRAVRQDAVIQNLSSDEMIQILEPIVRFLIYFGYVLVEEDWAVFNAHINDTHLQECMERLLVCYNEIGNVESRRRWEIESAYLLCCTGSIKRLTRGFGLYAMHPDKIFLDSLEVSLQCFLKNYVRVFKMLMKLPPLLLCLFCTRLPEIRKTALEALTHAFSSRNSCYPVCHLKNLLLFESDEHTVDECMHYGIKVLDGKINFLKNDFKPLNEYRRGVRLKWVDEILSKCDLIELLHNSKR